jgi:hypothetical protein
MPVRAPIELRLARHGAILLLLALLTGFVIGNLHNRQAGVAAHVTGLIGGYGLIALCPLWPKLSIGRVCSGAGVWITAASLYLSWLGLLFKGFAYGPQAPGSPLPVPSLVWDRAAAITLTMAVLLSLLSVLILLIGLRKLTTPAATEGAAIAMIATKD